MITLMRNATKHVKCLFSFTHPSSTKQRKTTLSLKYDPDFHDKPYWHNLKGYVECAFCNKKSNYTHLLSSAGFVHFQLDFLIVNIKTVLCLREHAISDLKTKQPDLVRSITKQLFFFLYFFFFFVLTNERKVRLYILFFSSSSRSSIVLFWQNSMIISQQLTF